MKILFYTNSFYPDPIGIAFYNAEWVDHLLSLGHEVEVVTAVPYYPQWSVAPDYRKRWRVKETYKQASVIRTWVYVPGRQTAVTRFLCELSFMLASLPIAFTLSPGSSDRGLTSFWRRLGRCLLSSAKKNSRLAARAGFAGRCRSSGRLFARKSTFIGAQGFRALGTRPGGSRDHDYGRHAKNG